MLPASKLRLQTGHSNVADGDEDDDEDDEDDWGDGAIFLGNFSFFLALSPRYESSVVSPRFMDNF